MFGKGWFARQSLYNLSTTPLDVVLNGGNVQPFIFPEYTNYRDGLLLHSLCDLIPFRSL